MKDGIYVYLKNTPYPVKNYPTDEAVFDINKLKSLFIEPIKLIRWYWLPILPFLYRDRQNLLDRFNRIAWRIISHQLLKPQYNSEFGRNLYYLVRSFLMNMGFTEDSSDKFATMFYHIFDFDNAYRMRLTDLLSETTTKQLTENPRREVMKLIKLLEEREYPHIAIKIKKVAILVYLALFIPKVKRAFIEAFKIGIEDIQYDDADRYFVCMRTDYKFMGKTFDERQVYAYNRGWVYPKANKK